MLPYLDIYWYKMLKITKLGNKYYFARSMSKIMYKC